MSLRLTRLGEKCARGGILFLALLATAGLAHAGTVSVAWDALNHPDVVGYRLYLGTSSGNYTQTVDVGLTTETTLPGLADCTTHYVTVRARAADDRVSEGPSNEIVGWPRPELQASTPATVDRASRVDLTIDGTNFMAGATVELSDPAIVVHGVTVVGCNQIVVDVTIPADAAVGTRSVTVINPSQVVSQTVNLFTVANAAPDGQIDQPNGDRTITAGESVNFAATGSDPDDDTPLTYRWNFGDPGIPDSTQQNPGAVTFDSAGTYVVSLTVTDALGLADPSADTVTITVDEPAAPSITGIAATGIGSTTATVVWTTDQPGDSQVLFRRVGDAIFQSTAVDAALVTAHSVELLGLRPGTTYEYSVRTENQAGLAANEPAPSTFTTQGNGFTYLRIEAESGPVGSPAETLTDADAFRGGAVRLAPGTPAGTPSNPSGSWDYGFHTSTAGTWSLWYRVRGSDASSDEWFGGVDGAALERIAAPADDTWTWIAGTGVSLAAGSHVLTLGGAEAGARIDRVLITDDATFVPTEMPNGDTVPPLAVNGLVASPGDGEVTLDWTNPAEPGPFRVVVRFTTGDTPPLHPADGLPLADLAGTAGGAESLLHAALVNDTTYRYAVFVIDASDNASERATATATPVPLTTPLGEVQNLRRTDVLE